LGIPITKSDVYARYFGNMVRGKFNGPVNVHSNGKTGHAIFADGKRTSRWASGPAPSRSELDRELTAKAAEPVKQEVAANPQPASAADRLHPGERPITRALPVESGPEQPVAVAKTEKSAPHTEPPAPAAGPLQYKRAEVSDQNSASSTKATAANEVGDQKPEVSDQTSELSLLHAKPATAASEVRDQRSEISDQKSDQAADAAKRDGDNSLRLLAGPPSALHMKPVSEGPPAGASPDAAPSSYTNARLTKEEVADFADAEARSRGYDLSDYQRMDPQYFPADEIWTLGYNGTREIEKHFSVTIDDKTKGRVFVPGK
jgi:hypothetical protein